MAVAKNGNPVRIIPTKGTEPDCRWALELISGLNPRYLLADKAYDSNEILQFLESRKIEASIPPSANRKIQRNYHCEIYKKRHRIENAFLRLKQWRAIATRYAKNIRSFLAAFHIRCIMLALSNCDI